MNKHSLVTKLKSYWDAGCTTADQYYNKLPLDRINQKAKEFNLKIDVKSSSFKKILSGISIIFLCLLLYSSLRGGFNTIQPENVVMRDGLLYQVNSKKPYSGIIMVNSDNLYLFLNRFCGFELAVPLSTDHLRGVPRCKTPLKIPYQNGLMEGKIIIRHRKGPIAYKATFKHGKLHGKSMIYDSAGNLIHKFTWENGIPCF